MNPLAALGFLKDHWRIAAVVVGGLAIFACGWRGHARFNPCPTCAPAIAKVEDVKKASADLAQTDTAKHEGSKERIKLNFDQAYPRESITPRDLCRPIVVPGLDTPVMVPAGERLESVEIEREGPTDSETKSSSSSVATEDRHLDLKVTPPSAVVSQPRLELQLGFEDVLHRRALRPAARLRLTERFWVEGSWIPADKTYGVAFAIALF